MRCALATLALAAGLATAACATDTASDSSDISALKDLWDDGKNLDLGDLLSLTAGYATDELNDALELSDFASIRLAETELYALAEDAEEDLTLHDIDQLVSGLVYRYGERELTTEVNVVRRNHLLASDDVAYAESAFSIKYGLHDWGHTSQGWADGSSVRIGFDLGKTMEARVVTAFDSELDAQLKAPLKAARALRGFVLPRGVDDMRRMKPGESYALRGAGRLGFNLGVGVPILTTVIEAVTYNLVMSAGLRTLLTGTVDVQLVRLDGDRIVIDVGVEKSAVDYAKIALTDGWGVSGLVQSHITLGPLELDLGRLVERALEKRLDQKLDLVDARADYTKQINRISVARFRVDLDRATPGSSVERALAQLLHADLRLAQALSNRGEPGIAAEFELSRSGVSSTSYAGIDLLGMRFFRKQQQSGGTIVVQTPGGAQALNFESLHKSSGWFFSSHGFTRVGLAGLVFDAEHPEGADGQANLLIQVLEGDDLMERDKLLDHLDGVILGIGGPDALAAIEGPSNELERHVEKACPSGQAFDPCRKEVLTTPEVQQLAGQAHDALLAALTAQGVEPSLRDLALTAGDMRIIAQATYEPKATFVGPPTSIIVDYRIDDGALRSLMLDHDRQDVEQAFVRYVQAAHIDRIDKPSKIAQTRAELANDVKDVARDVGDVFQAYSARYRHLAEAERLVLPNHPELGEMGARALEVRFPVDSGNKVKYQDAVARSLAQARAHTAAKMFDALVDEADDAKGLNHGEQIVAYTLLSLTPQDRVDLRLDVDMDLDDSLAQSYEHYRLAGYRSFDVYARGSAAERIDGGLFDIDALMNVD